MLGLVAAGGVGYYLYNAGGSPKVAEKKFESTSLLRCSLQNSTRVSVPPCVLRQLHEDPIISLTRFPDYVPR
jgi:hypothetical protein